MAKATELDWMEVDPADLGKGEVGKAYEAYKAVQAKAAAERAKFEAAFKAEAAKKGHIPEGKDIAFGYRFGRLSVAWVEAKKKAGNAAKFKL